jgi:hypothetical protein
MIITTIYEGDNDDDDDDGGGVYRWSQYIIVLWTYSMLEESMIELC